MNILSCLYTLIISPLELLFESIFTVAYRLIGNEGLSIIFLSLAVNCLVLPLYKRADELQAEERDIQLKMAPWIKHIKKTFSGDERFFMLQEYYRINHYKPVYALKSSLSVMLQIPFFIAAYNLLSGMGSLKGMSFGFISDLGQEDSMFMIGSFPVNVLPILMTTINIVSGIIYTKGHPLKEKIQVYGLAAVFLVLLYHSPSGLVFYWLLNNVFSLIKNIFYKLKNPKKVLRIVLAATGVALLISSILRQDLDVRQKILLSLSGVILGLPLVFALAGNKAPVNSIKCTNDRLAFFSGAAMMAVFSGLFIPSSVISSSSLEFIDILNPTDPVLYIVNSVLLAFGSWVLWGGVFYFFMSKKVRSLFCVTIWIICGLSLFNYKLFGTRLGTLSSTLEYETKPSFQATEYLFNSLGVIIIAFVLCVLYQKIHVVVKPLIFVGILTLTVFGALNITIINSTYNWFENSASNSSEMPQITLSKTGKNVIVLELDRALGNLVPYILNEKPELKEKFDGFTYYPNTISYGNCTIYGVPSLFGGYEYTPERINERNTESLVNKHNEALMVLPVLFGENGYKVTICDPPYAGYNQISDLSIYNEHPEFKCYITDGRFNFFEDESDGSVSPEAYEFRNNVRNRNLFCFSLMKVSPLILQETLYNDGSYNQADSASGNSGSVISASSLVHRINGLSISTGYEKVFLDSYTVLKKLPDITIITGNSENTLLLLSNDTTHSPCLLQKPDYIPSLNVDNTKFDNDADKLYTVNGTTLQLKNEYQVTHYHVNMAALLQLANWFDYMRENGVYDNTRIIISSDHGRGLDQFNVKKNGIDLEYYMPLYLVKDFNATGFKTSPEFMTLGDTPTIATYGLISNPKNPFTGNPIDSKAKSGPQTVFFTTDHNPKKDGETLFKPTARFILNGNPHDPANWNPTGN